MAWKWIQISLKSWMVSWYKNEIIRAVVSNCMRQCLNYFGTKHTHSRIPGLKGEALFSVFVVVSANRRGDIVCRNVPELPRYHFLTTDGLKKLT